jgi:endoglycosylceramidase
MNVIRLVVSWSALEPRRGHFDERYLARIRRAVRMAKANDIYVVIDMHQDAWGKFIATPQSETCVPPARPQHGWDGAPAWATLTGGVGTCFTGLREIAPAVQSAFQSFYDDDQGIQRRLVRTWARLARAFAAEPAVAGYDLLNEPGLGLDPTATTQALAQFYARSIGAIRRSERAVDGGFSHIAFFEPSVLWSGLGTSAVPDPAIVDFPNTVFAPHIYAGSIAPIPVAAGFDNAAAAAAQYRTTVWSGEWGFFSEEPADDEANLREYAAQEDRHLWGGALWDWKQSCGDVHMYSDRDDTTPAPISTSLNRFACPGNRPLGIPPTTRRILSRPYVRFAPGHLRSLESDPDAGTARVSGVDRKRRGSCALELWVPGSARPKLKRVRTGRLGLERVRGGWVVRACAFGRWSIRDAEGGGSACGRRGH